ncbi:hypothetical protein ACI77J_14810 [Pseudomonas sp. O64]|uniref:phage tail terminator protein n=1 Tax=unclassified Pseudomonas TaxID=196821 RepID=UPI0021DB4E96|nr:hypothetical protein [Pseudomonas sp. YeP6b]UXZ20664.1 hypothetical protein KZH41_19285 [Pseudomonas sp. YeP6b]
MKLIPIIKHLRNTCPTFKRRVYGGLDWDPVAKSVQTDMPAAYVICIGDAAEPSEVSGMIRQRVRDAIDVNVEVWSEDERGQGAADLIHDLRAELWRALVGFKPGGDGTPLQYDDGELLLIDRSKAVYRFRFFTEFVIGRDDVRPGQKLGPPETWQEVEHDGLPPFDGVNIHADFKGPRNDEIPTPTGPDCRIETKAREDLRP